VKFVFDMQERYLQALRAVLRRQRRFKRMGKAYAGIKAPTDPETRRKALMWAAERRNVKAAWDEVRALVDRLRRGARLQRPPQVWPRRKP
jgi:plasmid stabilization system protein ParE